jgi:hypothetical protein
MSSKILFLAWQDPQTRRWFTVGRLRRMDTGDYEFVYVEGFNSARSVAGMEPLVGFVEPHLRYLSDRLFPLFQNRIMSPGRDEYRAYIQRLGFETAPTDPLEILARSEGHRTTDTLQVFPAPTLRRVENQSICSFEFFIHGMRYAQPDAQKVELEPGTTLFPMWDFQNVSDPNALTLRTSTNLLLGWVPRFYCTDILKLRAYDQKMELTVARMNQAPVPSWFRILCRLEAHCPEGFQPFSGEEFQPIAPQAAL